MEGSRASKAYGNAGSENGMTPPFAAVEVDIVPPYKSGFPSRRRLSQSWGALGEFIGQIRLIYTKSEIKLTGPGEASATATLPRPRVVQTAVKRMPRFS